MFDKRFSDPVGQGLWSYIWNRWNQSSQTAHGHARMKFTTVHNKHLCVRLHTSVTVVANKIDFSDLFPQQIEASVLRQRNPKVKSNNPTSIWDTPRIQRQHRHMTLEFDDISTLFHSPKYSNTPEKTPTTAVDQSSWMTTNQVASKLWWHRSMVHSNLSRLRCMLRTNDS